MNRIFKYELQPKVIQEIDIHADAMILHVHEQFGAMCLWAAVNPDAPVVKKKFAVIPTGRVDIELAEMDYIGTVHMQGGSLVFHVFQEAVK